jgi:hypothetical protein
MQIEALAAVVGSSKTYEKMLWKQIVNVFDRHEQDLGDDVFELCDL